MNNLEPLKIFNDQTIGRIFLPDGLSYDKNLSLIPTILHGRSIAVKKDNFEWILIKGGGWNYGGPSVYISKKDAELVFGLCPLEAGKRELQISKRIEMISDRFPKVLYYRRLSDFDLPEAFSFLKTIKYSDGKLVDPCLLYTAVKCPYRIADLIYLTDSEKMKCIEICCDFLGISKNDYIKNISVILAKNIAILHKNSFINDTLEFSNVTLLGEIVDYELITHPNVPFEDGDFGQEKINERKEKEILYAAEIILQLSNLLHEKMTFFEAYRDICKIYEEIDSKFIRTNQSIQKILQGERFVYEIQ